MEKGKSMKTIEEKIAVMQAFKEGKEIEFAPNSIDKIWVSCKGPDWDWDWSMYDYRIKEEPKKPEYIPFSFEDAEFLIGKAIKSKTIDVVLLIQVVYPKTVMMHGFDTISYYLLLLNWEFLDGSPCGKLKQ